MDKLQPPFAGSISQSANLFIFFVFDFFKNKTKQNKNGEEPFRRSKVTLPFCLTYSQGDDFFMLSPHIWATFLALIPPSFTSLNLLEKFLRPWQLHSSSHNGKICMRIPGSTLTLLVTNRKCSHAKQAVQTKSVRLWMSKEHFHKELSRVIKQIILYILSFNCSNRYEINLVRIIFAGNSSIKHSAAKKKLAGYWAPDINT